VNSPAPEACIAGRGEYLRFLEQWWSEFDEPTVDVNGLADAGEHMLASVTFRGGGKQSRVETTWSLWQLWTVRDGKIVRGQGFTGREDALEAAAMR
jgi:hypothetical protein